MIESTPLIEQYARWVYGKHPTDELSNDQVATVHLLDVGLIANHTKLLAITAESSAQLHEAAYQETLVVIVEKILDLIFEEGEQDEKQ